MRATAFFMSRFLKSPVPLTKALEQSLKAQGGTVETVWHPGGHEIRAGEIDAVRGFLAAYGE